MNGWINTAICDDGNIDGLYTEKSSLPHPRGPDRTWFSGPYKQEILILILPHLQSGAMSAHALDPINKKS
jgi:hypothetical protein